MLLFNDSVRVSRKLCPLLLEVCNSAKFPSFIPSRTITYKYDVKKPKKTSPEYELRPVHDIDDPNFSHNLGIILRNPHLFVKGFKGIGKEVKRFYKEQSEALDKSWNPQMGNKHDKIDILHKFETPEDLKGFEVHTDSSFNCGFSSASLKITQEGTGLFSGTLCDEPPKDGYTQLSGFATMFSPIKRRAFFRVERYNWTDYTHLVLKVRGDGRSYLVVLNVPESQDQNKHFKYAHPLYTRGGPYWQIVKMPLSHFFLMVKGVLPTRGHDEDIVLTRILRMGITAAGYGGQFKLEIDYIGLTFDKYHNPTRPYEEYML